MRATENDTVLPHNVTLAKELPPMKALRSRRALKAAMQPVLLRTYSFSPGPLPQPWAHPPSEKQ